jgi:hypothetical protein
MTSAPAPGKEKSMVFDKNEMIEQLKLEIAIVEKGGYYPSVREPRQEPRIFRDSITCLNVGFAEKRVPCSNCFLMQFVPADFQNLEEPCHHIPLNRAGESVATLQVDPYRLRAALLEWLYTTVARLEMEVQNQANIS